jgi:hypothetical protein
MDMGGGGGGVRNAYNIFIRELEGNGFLGRQFYMGGKY